jgi:DNA-directed RNA polymerase specialized sigma24 family protein
MSKGKTDIEKDGRVVFIKAVHSRFSSLLMEKLAELDLEVKERAGGIEELLENYWNVFTPLKDTMEMLYTEQPLPEGQEIRACNNVLLHFYGGNKAARHLRMPVELSFLKAEVPVIIQQMRSHNLRRDAEDCLEDVVCGLSGDKPRQDAALAAYFQMRSHNLRRDAEDCLQDTFSKVFSERLSQNFAADAFPALRFSFGDSLESDDDLSGARSVGGFARACLRYRLGAYNLSPMKFLEPLRDGFVSRADKTYKGLLDVFDARSYSRPTFVSCTGGKHTETEVLAETNDPAQTITERLQKVYDRNYNKLKIAALRMGEPAGQAEDLVQSAFYDLILRIKEHDLKLKTDDDLFAYLLMTVKVSLMNRRKRGYSKLLDWAMEKKSPYGRRALEELQKTGLDEEEHSEYESLFNFPEFLSEETKQHCIDGKGLWPDEPKLDATDGELEGFYKHSKSCSYHQRLIEKEEKELSRTLRTLEAVFESDRNNKDDEEDQDEIPVRSVIGWKDYSPIVYKFSDVSNKQIQEFLEKIKDSLAAAFPAYTVVCVFSIGIAKSQAALLFFSLSSLAEDKGVSVVSHYITDTEMCQFQASFDIIGDRKQLYDISQDFRNHIGIASCHVYNKTNNKSFWKIQDESNEVK